jgi:hypothetical protein
VPVLDSQTNRKAKATCKNFPLQMGRDLASAGGKTGRRST